MAWEIWSAAMDFADPSLLQLLLLPLLVPEEAAVDVDVAIFFLDFDDDIEVDMGILLYSASSTLLAIWYVKLCKDEETSSI